MKHHLSRSSDLDLLRDQYKKVAHKCGIQVLTQSEKSNPSSAINLQYLNGECWATDTENRAFQLTGQLKCSLFLFMQMLEFKTGQFTFNLEQGVLFLKSFKVNSHTISFVKPSVSIVDLAIASELKLARI